MPLDRRLQVLIDDERLRHLRSESEATGTPIGAIVRQAIDQRLGAADDPARRAAYRALLEEPLPSGLEPDWEIVKAEMLDGRVARYAGDDLE